LVVETAVSIVIVPDEQNSVNSWIKNCWSYLKLGFSAQCFGCRAFKRGVALAQCIRNLFCHPN